MNVVINDTNLTNIANAIREKSGSNETYKPSEMAAAIAALSVGGGVDFSKLEYTTVSSPSSSTNADLPDLSSIVEDFSKIVLMFWTSGTSTNYLFIKGVNGKKIFTAGYNNNRFTYRTPYDTAYNELQGELNSLQVYSSSAGTNLSKPFKGTMFIYHE